jgi:hypothetical protein
MDLVIRQVSQLIGARENNDQQLKAFLIRLLLLAIVVTIGAVLNIHWSIIAFTLVVSLVQLERVYNKIENAKSRLLKIELGKKIIDDLYHKYGFIDKIKIENLSTKKDRKAIELTIYTVVYDNVFQQEYLYKIKNRLKEKHQFTEVCMHLSTID